MLGTWLVFKKNTKKDFIRSLLSLFIGLTCLPANLGLFLYKTFLKSFIQVLSQTNLSTFSPGIPLLPFLHSKRRKFISTFSFLFLS